MVGRRLFASVTATPEEVARTLPGDELLPDADVVMDRAFTLPARPAMVWPWLVQLGKRRAGWYLTRQVERFVPPRRRAVRGIDRRWQGLEVGTVIPDYGGRDETFTVAQVEEPSHLVYTSRRGRTEVTWAIVLTAYDGNRSRVQLRLRLHPVKRIWLAESAGDLFDALTVAGMAAGLRERLSGAR
jgi:hypothetical protein